MTLTLILCYRGKVEAPETVRYQLWSPIKAHVSTSGVPNLVITSINYEYQVSNLIGLEMKDSYWYTY